MIKRTLEISREPAHLAVQFDQLTIKRGDQVAGSLPCEDLGVVVVDQPQTTYTHALLSRMMEAGAVLVICGRNHLPNGLLIPLSGHTEVVWRLRDQMQAPRPLQKRLWQQIVRAKIKAQGGNLAVEGPTCRKLLQIAREVRSGDSAAHESQAARLYWSAWLTETPAGCHQHDSADVSKGVVARESCRFRRDPEGDGLNAILNYGYAIVRAAVARAIVSAGLNPALGLQHSNRGNAFCLADDLMEPLRPMVDRVARRLWWADRRQLDQPTKSELLEILAEDVFVDDQCGPLMVALHRYVASLSHCLRREERGLAIPLPRAFAQWSAECLPTWT